MNKKIVVPFKTKVGPLRRSPLVYKILFEVIVKDLAAANCYHIESTSPLNEQDIREEEIRLLTERSKYVDSLVDPVKLSDHDRGKFMQALRANYNVQVPEWKASKREEASIKVNWLAPTAYPVFTYNNKILYDILGHKMRLQGK